MKIKLVLFTLSALTGALFYLMYNEHIVILFPQHHIKFNAQNSEQSLTATSILLFLPDTQNATFTTETAMLKRSYNTHSNHEQILQTWLNTQNAPTHKIKLRSIALSPDQRNIFINFVDISPFAHQTSTYNKLLWIQALFKTLHAYNNKLEYVYFLVNNKPVEDYELDFSRPWPIIGFI